MRERKRISLYCLRNLVLILVILYSNRPYSSSIIKSDREKEEGIRKYRLNGIRWTSTTTQ